MVEEGSMIEFKSTFDSTVTKKLNFHQMKKFWWLYALFMILFIFMGAVGVITQEDESDLILGITLIVIGAVFPVLCILLTILLQRRVDKSMSILSGDTTETYQFYPDKLVITMTKGDEYEGITTAKYSYLYRVEETEENYFLLISKTQSHVVNKRDLTQGTIEELDAILSSNLGANFKRKNG